MTTCLGKSCSFGLPRIAFRKLLSIYVFSCFPFGFEGRMWDLIVSVLDHCLSFYFEGRELVALFVCVCVCFCFFFFSFSSLFCYVYNVCHYLFSFLFGVIGRL